MTARNWKRPRPEARRITEGSVKAAQSGKPDDSLTRPDRRQAYCALVAWSPRGRGSHSRNARKKTKFIVAARRAGEARQMVANQHALIARLKASGHPTLDAERALRTYISALKHLEDHERRVRKEGKAKNAKPKRLELERFPANYYKLKSAVRDGASIVRPGHMARALLQ